MVFARVRRDRRTAVLTIAAIAAIASACGAQSATAPSPTPTAPGGVISMSPEVWSFRYSPNMPASPAPAGSGWQFTFPNRNGVQYVTTSQRPASASEAVVAKFSIETSGDPYFEYRTEASNTCDAPATVRLFLQRRGDNMSGEGGYEFYRWWSNPVAYRLGSGSATLVGDLTDPSQWTSVMGRRGSDNDAAFRAALADLGTVGFTFGGGCFFGHGVYVTPGTGQAVFTATEFIVK